jgi:predicted membrane protein
LILFIFDILVVTLGPYGGTGELFALPVVLAVVALVFAVRARRRLDMLVSALVIAAIPLWILAIIVAFQFMGPLPDNSFMLP